MDWLFDNNKNNAEHLITILANESTSQEIYVKEPIRLFIELMWVKFKPRIIVGVFLPYVVYLSLLYTLTGHLLNSFLINLAEMRFMSEVCAYANELHQAGEFMKRVSVAGGEADKASPSPSGSSTGAGAATAGH